MTGSFPAKKEEEFKDIISKYKNSPSLLFFEIDKKNLSAEKINKFKNILDTASPGFKRFLGAENPDFAVSDSLDWIGTRSGRYYKEDAEKTKPVMELNNLDFNSDRNSADGL